MSTTNDSQPLTVIIKSFALDAKGMLDQTYAGLVRAKVLIRYCTLSVSAVQNSTITLE